MKDDPLELMEPWRLLLLVAWVLVVLPLAAAVAAAVRWGAPSPPGGPAAPAGMRW